MTHIYYFIVYMGQNSRYGTPGLLQLSTSPKASWSSESSAEGGPVFKVVHMVVIGRRRLCPGYCPEMPVPWHLSLSIEQQKVWHVAQRRMPGGEVRADVDTASASCNLAENASV